MQYPLKENLNCNTCTERSIKIHYYDFWQYLINNYPRELTWGERLYWFYHNLNDYPRCPICNNVVGFTNFRVGYKTYCSRKCMNIDPNKKEKTIQTCIERYGGVAPASSKSVLKKMQDTTMEKYGVDNIQKLDAIKEKTRQTCLERYNGQGNESDVIKKKYENTCYGRFANNNPMKNKMVIENYRNNSFEKYGVYHPSQTELIKDKIRVSRRDYEMDRNPNILGYTENGYWMYSCTNLNCNKCEEKYFIISPLMYDSRKNNGTEICTKLLPIGKDNTKNTTIEIFIQSILNDLCEYECNNRIIIKPKELDIYIPNKQIAIECNGVYSHSIKHKTQSYHIQKYNECKSKNIRLISLWEDWVKTKPEIVRSILLNKLGVCNNTIYARKTIIKEIDSRVCNEFLDSNHIQGRSAANIRLGLYLGDELISVMTFSKPRINMGSNLHKQQWELVRFCNKLNTRVIGGASKLLKYFIKTYQPTSIVSFSMNDISDGNLYKMLGFETDGKITHSYWYIDPKTLKRYHRSSFTKQSIVKKGWRDKIDNSWTEKQVMEEQGYFCIYDSGQLKWVLNIE